ncbi:MAG TPA: hypothetical protein VLC95_00670 [Anaerolineae bacterium]|nr:hypothetical protein [Anaerolineae bacterium]
MIRRRPGLLILIGFLMVLFGAVVPFLMIMGVLQSGFLLGFLSYAASITGLLLGLIGLAWNTRIDRG